MRIAFVGSGSKGNATFVLAGGVLIQIDCGLPRKRLISALSSWGKELEDIEGVFITHDHRDHVGTLEYLPKKIPVFSSPCSLPEESLFEVLEPYVGVNIGPVSILPFSVSHDAPNPLNYLIVCGEEKFGYVTDTGMLDDTALSLLSNCDYYLFESNHDLRMLARSKRPPCLKRRIRGDHGHLNNVQSAQYCAQVMGPKTKAIYLGHISEECNTPEKAVLAYRRVFAERDIDLDSIAIIPTKQHETVFGGSEE
ncbi:MAG: MBL fold metallo-hydrolase [Candidatus Enteromonas sp.]|nr:MBL fold metallo-hydrolase [Candidatus Enteromonas sp.]